MNIFAFMDSPLTTFLQLLRHIPDEDKVLINKAFEARVVKEGDELFSPGHVCHQLFFISKGVLRIIVHNEKGVPVIHYFLKQHQFCTILKSFTEQIPTHEAIQAACDSDIMVVNRNVLFKLYEQLPYLKVLIDQVIHQALLDKINTRNAYLGHDSTERYKLFMMRQPDVAAQVSLTDVASYLGITPQSLSRIRKQIK